MSRAYLDTNVLVRFLTGEPPGMAQRALDLFSRAERGDIVLILDEIVIAETVWVLTSHYKHRPQDITRALNELLIRELFHVRERDIMVEALSLFASHSVDFADALIAARMRRDGVGSVFSFDTHFDRLPGVTRLEPGALSDLCHETS